MADIDNMIVLLAESAAPVKPATHPFAICIAWFVIMGAYLTLMLLVFGVRPDIALKWEAPLFVSEVGSLALLLVTCMVSVSLLSFPDMHQKRWMTLLPVAPLLMFISVLTMEYLSDVPPAPKPEHSFICLMCIALYSVVPAVSMMLFLRRRFTTHPRLTGAVALITASSIGCLTLRLSEQTDSIAHLIQWHYLPMIGFGLLGVYLGKLFLKW